MHSRVRHPRLAAGQAVDKEAVDGAKPGIARRSPNQKPRHFAKAATDLGPRKVGSSTRRSFCTSARWPRLAQLGAAGGGAAVLPDNRVVQRFSIARKADGGFALVGDADGRNLAWVDVGRRKRLTKCRQDRLPNRLWIMFDPAGLRVDLRELGVAAADDNQRLAKQSTVEPVVP